MRQGHRCSRVHATLRLESIRTVVARAAHFVCQHQRLACDPRWPYLFDGAGCCQGGARGGRLPVASGVLISLSALGSSQSVRGSCLGFSIPCGAVRRPDRSGSLPRRWWSRSCDAAPARRPARARARARRRSATRRARRSSHRTACSRPHLGVTRQMPGFGPPLFAYAPDFRGVLREPGAVPAEVVETGPAPWAPGWRRDAGIGGAPAPRPTPRSCLVSSGDRRARR